MYYPYFRGKQFELITIREKAELMADSGFVPIVEPVKETLRGLERTLNAVCDAGGQIIVIVNPYHGDHKTNGAGITELLGNRYLENVSISAGIILTDDIDLQEVMECYKAHSAHSPTFIHAGFTDAKALANALGDELPNTQHVFFEKHGKLYRKHFSPSHRILLNDGFRRQRNADYPPLEPFSDLHAIYEDEGMNGFGDFLVVGDDFSEGGGPAYAVAIHLTFIDPDKDDAMFIYHFVSKTRDTPTDPAGKFGEALNLLIENLDSGTSNLYETKAIREFRALHAKGHFPGLGYVKKLSMNHHIETLSEYLKQP